MYLTFARYQEIGGKLTESNFIRAEMTARMKIDSVTQNRLQKLDADDPIWERVGFLVLELIERGYLGSLEGKDFTSESMGKMSVTWESKAGKADELIKSFLPSFVNQGIQTARVLRA